jgi:energy-coupling factor transport system permease protein
VSEGRSPPGPILALAVAVAALAFRCDDPLILAALTAGVLVLFLRAPARPGRLYLVGGLVTGLGLLVLNPFVTSDGEHILFSGPQIPIIDTEVTAEELVAGAVAGLRIFCVAVLVGAALAHMDGDRLLARLARLAPRSAMLLALSARLLPVLQRDARAISETARLRGLDLSVGGWAGRAKRAAPLALPLVGSSLERGLDIAEAMTARGYGSGPRTPLAERPYGRADWAVLGLAVPVAILAGLAAAGVIGAYRFYPTLQGAPGAEATAAALAALAALCVAAALLPQH